MVKYRLSNKLMKKLNDELIYHVTNNSIHSVIYLLKKGANVNYTDDRGYFPLYIAIENEYIDLTKILLEYNSDVNQTDANGNTPLFLLCTNLMNNNTIELFDALIQYGANVNHINYDNITPLICVCLANNKYLIDKLIQCNVHIGYKNDYGLTVFNYCKNPKVIEYLNLYNK